MTSQEYTEKIEAALGDSPDSWCGCYEGDMSDEFPKMKKHATDAITTLTIDLLESLLREKKLLLDHPFDSIDAVPAATIETMIAQLKGELV